MKLIGILFMLASLAAGIWAVNKTVAAMHDAANVMRLANR